MNDEQNLPAQLPTAPFPAPPPFWKHFTVENAARLTAVEEDNNDPAKALPLELTFLKPPPPPAATSESYTVFAIPQSLTANPALPPAEILLFNPQSPTFKPASLLSRLTKSLLLNFLELTTILGNDPIQYADKMADINRLMLNVHFVINLYRPHQTREGVKEMLEGRLEDCKREIAECDAIKAKVETFLQSIASTETGQDDADGLQSETPDSAVKAKANSKLWHMINSIEDN